MGSLNSRLNKGGADMKAMEVVVETGSGWCRLACADCVDL